MSINSIGRRPNELRIQGALPRQTEKPVSTFSQVLRGGAQVLLAGAEIATGMVGGSILSAALARAREKLAGNSSGGMTPTTYSGTVPAGSSGSTLPGQTAYTQSSGGTKNEVDAMRQLQEEAKQNNLFFLEIQEKMQQENRKFSTVSNVLKAQHDTARAAINNIRT